MRPEDAIALGWELVRTADLDALLDAAHPFERDFSAIRLISARSAIISARSLVAGQPTQEGR